MTYSVPVIAAGLGVTPGTRSAPRLPDGRAGRPSGMPPSESITLLPGRFVEAEAVLARDFPGRMPPRPRFPPSPARPAARARPRGLTSLDKPFAVVRQRRLGGSVGDRGFGQWQLALDRCHVNDDACIPVPPSPAPARGRSARRRAGSAPAPAASARPATRRSLRPAHPIRRPRAR